MLLSAKDVQALGTSDHYTEDIPYGPTCEKFVRSKRSNAAVTLNGSQQFKLPIVPRLFLHHTHTGKENHTKTTLGSPETSHETHK